MTFCWRGDLMLRREITRCACLVWVPQMSCRKLKRPLLSGIWERVVSASQESISKTLYGETRAVVNAAQSPTADFVSNPHWQFPDIHMQGQCSRCCRRIVRICGCQSALLAQPFRPDKGLQRLRMPSTLAAASTKPLSSRFLLTGSPTIPASCRGRCSRAI